MCYMFDCATVLDNLKLGRRFRIIFSGLWQMLFPKSCVFKFITTGLGYFSSYSIVMSRCLRFLFLTFAMFMKLLLMIVFTLLTSVKESRYGFKISPKHQRLSFVSSLLINLIWLCETVILRSYALSNCKRMTNINHICIDVWGQTTRSGMHFPAI